MKGERDRDEKNQNQTVSEGFLRFTGLFRSVFAVDVAVRKRTGGTVF